MNPRISVREAQAQLNRLIAVFPHHGLSDLGIDEYADTMARIFTNEWHMQRVVDEAKRTCRRFPSLAELRDLADEISASKSPLAGCPDCLHSMPGMAYVRALWTPGANGRPGRFERVSEAGLEATYPGIEATRKAAHSEGRGYDGQEAFDLPFAWIREGGETVEVLNRRAPSACVVGYCSCPAGVELRARHAAERAEKQARREKRQGKLEKAAL